MPAPTERERQTLSPRMATATVGPSRNRARPTLAESVGAWRTIPANVRSSTTCSNLDSDLAAAWQLWPQSRQQRSPDPGDLLLQNRAGCGGTQPSEFGVRLGSSIAGGPVLASAQAAGFGRSAPHELLPLVECQSA